MPPVATSDSITIDEDTLAHIGSGQRCGRRWRARFGLDCGDRCPTKWHGDSQPDGTVSYRPTQM